MPLKTKKITKIQKNTENKNADVVLFLSFDGTLCLDGDSFENIPLKNLRNIVKKTNAKIVDFSCWRLFPHLVRWIDEQFDKNNIPKVFDHIEKDHEKDMGDKILEYVKKHKVKKWVVVTSYVSDFLGFDKLPPRKIIKTDELKGINKPIANRIVQKCS